MRLVALCLLLFCVPSAFGGTIVATDTGYYSSTTGHNSANKSFEIGAPGAKRGYFVFDLVGQSGTLLSAQLRLVNSDIGTNGTLSIWDVTTPLPDLQANQGPIDSLPIYGDLGAGVQFGSLSLVSAGSLVTIDLNASALTSLASAFGSQIAFGSNLSPSTSSLFTSSNIGDASLILNFAPLGPLSSVPEPSSFALIGAIGAFGVWKRRRSQKGA